MNLETKHGVESKSSQIEGKINKVLGEIKKEFIFKGNSLQELINFKFEKQKENALENSSEYKNALIQEITSKAQSGEIQGQNSESFGVTQYEILANKIIEIHHLTKEIQKDIQDLRREVTLEGLKIERKKDMLTRGRYSQETLTRIENPENINDQLLGFGIGIFETITVIGKLGYDITKGIILAPYHIVQIIRGKAKYDGVEI